MARSRNSSNIAGMALAKAQPPGRAKQPASGARGGKPRLVVSRRKAGPGRRNGGPVRSAEPAGLTNFLTDIEDEDESPYERPLVPMVREVKAPRRSRRD